MAASEKTDNVNIPKVWLERGFWVAILAAVLGYFGLDVVDKQQPKNANEVQSVVVDKEGTLVPGVTFEQFAILNAQVNAERVYSRASLADHAAHIAVIERKLNLPTIQPGAAPPLTGATGNKQSAAPATQTPIGAREKKD